MIGEPRDRSAYGLSLASLGLALTVLLAGICWIITQQSTDSVHTTLEICQATDHCVISKTEELSQLASVPDGLWIALVALGGALVGTLVPFPLPRSFDDLKQTCNWPWYVGFLLVASIVVLVVDPASTQVLLAVGFGALLLGFLIPSPVGDE